jgi:putative transposase
MDFMADRLAGGRAYRLLTVMDCFSRECLNIDVNGSMSGSRVVRVLNEIAASRGLPEVITIDNGPEFRSKTLQAWAQANGVRLHYIDPGRPTQNAFIESFNGIVRAECLEIRYVDTIGEARMLITAWREDYNRERGHGSLGDQTPEEFAASAPRAPFREVINTQAIRSDNVRLMEKRKTHAFPSFPQAPPRSGTASRVP